MGDTRLGVTPLRTPAFNVSHRVGEFPKDRAKVRIGVDTATVLPPDRRIETQYMRA